RVLFRSDPKAATRVNVADPRAAGKLIKGFYNAEVGAWRWTAREFAVALTPPRSASQGGAELVLQFTIAPATIEKLKTVSLSASIGDLKLPPEQYSAPGAYTYVRDVPANEF